MYLNKRDRRGRCIVVCDVPKIAEFLGEDLMHMSNAVNFMLTYGIDKCALPSKAETWNLIVDLNGMGMSQIPLKSLKQMLGAA
jgi:hypothetical protein